MAAQARELLPYESAIQKAKDRFEKVHSLLSYDRESIFAMQALMKNDFVLQVANKNPQSVHLAMVNLASTGLTLNPANGYAYLVPRDGAIVLDISYKGLIKIATDTGSIQWARADVVHERDQFEYHGPARVPDHSADPFAKDRGEVIGAYCIAKTAGGDVLTEVIDLQELEKIRSKSQAWAKKEAGPWAEWFDQMCKKAVIKRASKTWPYTEKSERLAEAVQIANDSEGGYDLAGNESGIAPAQIVDTRKQRHDEAVEQYWPQIESVKHAIRRDESELAVTLWAEIPQAAQMDLWLAPTKGGTFSTAERNYLTAAQSRYFEEHGKSPTGEAA